MLTRRTVLIFCLAWPCGANAFTHATIASTPTNAAALASSWLEAGALTAVASPSGTSVSVLLPPDHNLESGDLTAADLEEMWEPDDWNEQQVTFEPMRIDARLAVKPLPAAAKSAAAASLKDECCAEVRLLEHPHAFLTTAAGKLHASTLNVLELLVSNAAELENAEAVLDLGCVRAAYMPFSCTSRLRSLKPRRPTKPRDRISFLHTGLRNPVSCLACLACAEP